MPKPSVSRRTLLLGAFGTTIALGLPDSETATALSPVTAKESDSPATDKLPWALGINEKAIYRTNAELDVAFARYADSGTRFLRINVDWNALEGAPGAYDNPKHVRRDALDYFFQKCAAGNIRVLASVAYAPVWATGGKAGSGFAPLPAFDVKYADFCEWFLRRYAVYNTAGVRTLEAIEIWNEPDLSDLFFKPYPRNSPVGAVRYATLVQAAGARIKSVRAAIGADDVLVGAPVIANPHGASWAPAGSQSWIDAFYSVSGVTTNYDFFSWHSYWESVGGVWLPETVPPCWDATPGNQRKSVFGYLTTPAAQGGFIWAKMQAAGDHRKPNWCTETGGAARSAIAQHNAGRLLSFAEQAAHLADAHEVLSAGSVTNLERVYWYQLFDEPSTSNEQQSYGIVALNDTNPIVYNGPISLTASNLTPKPAYATYRLLTKSGGSVRDGNASDGDASDGDAGAGGVLFADNFKTGLATGWTCTPARTWAVANGRLGCPHNPDTAIAYAGSMAWTDYRVSCAIKFSDPWKAAGLLAGYNPATGSGYYLRIAVDEGKRSHTLRLYRSGALVASSSIQDRYDFSSLRNVALSIKADGSGVRVRGFVEGTEHIDYYDANAKLRQGKAGVRSEPWMGTISVQNFLVTSE